mmetsp:Transcript_98637/g.263756  ORF Transcript_98637/g.263756 Transcript_98637/m.263756 type:complete len:334 (+) Transcript_98637:1229-2230(+)
MWMLSNSGPSRTKTSVVQMHSIGASEKSLGCPGANGTAASFRSFCAACQVASWSALITTIPCTPCSIFSSAARASSDRLMSMILSSNGRRGRAAMTCTCFTAAASAGSIWAAANRADDFPDLAETAGVLGVSSTGADHSATTSISTYAAAGSTQVQSPGAASYENASIGTCPGSTRFSRKNNALVNARTLSKSKWTSTGRPGKLRIATAKTLVNRPAAFPDFASKHSIATCLRPHAAMVKPSAAELSRPADVGGCTLESNHAGGRRGGSHLTHSIGVISAGPSPSSVRAGRSRASCPKLVSMAHTIFVPCGTVLNRLWISDMRTRSSMRQRQQ